MNYSGAKRELLPIELSEAMRSVHRQMEAFVDFCASRGIACCVAALEPVEGKTGNIILASNGDDSEVLHCAVKCVELSQDPEALI